MKAKAPAKVRPNTDKPRSGLPGSSKERGERIEAAIKANRETLRRLAK